MSNETEIRRDLAAAYRLIAHFGWDDHVATHLSARLPDGSFLINRFGEMFDEVTASSLIRVAMDGTVLSPEAAPLNVAGYTVHSSVLDGRPDIGAAMHLHTHDGVAVSALEEGLLPLNQSVLLVWHDVGYHAFEGVVSREEERERLQADLAHKNLLILRNHGTLAVGATVADAFYRIYLLEWACTTQLRAQATGRPLTLPTPEVLARMEGMLDWSRPDRFPIRCFWPAMLRKAERLFPGFDR